MLSDQKGSAIQGWAWPNAARMFVQCQGRWGTRVRYNTHNALKDRVKEEWADLGKRSPAPPRESERQFCSECTTVSSGEAAVSGRSERITQESSANKADDFQTIA